jgi:transposase
MTEEVLSVKNAAIRVGKSEKTIYNWINSHQLNTMRGYVLLSELVEVERTMSQKRGRPRKTNTPQ